MSEVIKLFRNEPIQRALHEEIMKLIYDERFSALSNGTVVGVLEFAKWNIINKSDE